MLSLDILILGTALAIDAAIVSFTLGALGGPIHTNKQRWALGFYLAGLFGFFQFVMLWLGSRGGYVFTFSNFGHLFQLVIAGIFLIIGSKMIVDTFQGESKKPEWGLVSTFLLAVATSIDALAAGVSLGTLPESHLAALEVGVVTFLICLLFYFLSQMLKSLPDKWLLRLSGAVFVVMGAKVVFDYMKMGGM